MGAITLPPLDPGRCQCLAAKNNRMQATFRVIGVGVGRTEEVERPWRLGEYSYTLLDDQFVE